MAVAESALTIFRPLSSIGHKLDPVSTRIVGEVGDVWGFPFLVLFLIVPPPGTVLLLKPGRLSIVFEIPLDQAITMLPWCATIGFEVRFRVWVPPHREQQHTAAPLPRVWFYAL